MIRGGGIGRYAQVALTYTRPWWLRVWAVAAVVFLSWMPIEAATRGQFYQQYRTWPMGIMAVVLYAWLAAMVAAHAKEQLADARARVTPGFRKPHLVVAGLALSLALFVIAWTVWKFTGHFTPIQFWSYPVATPLTPIEIFGFVGMAAVLLFAGAVMAWLAHLQSPIFIGCWVAGLMLLALPRVQLAVMRVLFVDPPIATVAVLIVSIAALIALGFRLAGMHEEMPEYFRQSAASWKLRAAMTGDVALRRQAAAQTMAVDDWIRGAAALDRPASVAGASLWRRVQHWRVALGLGRTPWLVAVLIAAWMYAMPKLLPNRGGETAAELPAVFALMLPIVLAAHAWPRRWYVLGWESLFPLSRRRLLLEQGCAMALDLGVAWAAMMAAVLGLTVLTHPSQLAQPDFWLILLLLACWQAPLLGINLWVLRLRSGWLSFVTLIASALAEVLPVVLVRAIPHEHFPGSVAVAAVVVAAVGAAITWDAYRRWLKTDLD